MVGNGNCTLGVLKFLTFFFFLSCSSSRNQLLTFLLNVTRITRGSRGWRDILYWLSLDVLDSPLVWWLAWHWFCYCHCCAVFSLFTFSVVCLLTHLGYDIIWPLKRIGFTFTTTDTLAIPQGAFQSGFLLGLLYHLFLIPSLIYISPMKRMQEIQATVFILHHVQMYVCLCTEAVELKWNQVKINKTSFTLESPWSIFKLPLMLCCPGS